MNTHSIHHRTIQIKRAEREKKRQELETEFAAVFQEVEKKKKALERLEVALADMESTRERKDREFAARIPNFLLYVLILFRTTSQSLAGYQKSVGWPSRVWDCLTFFEFD